MPHERFFADEALVKGESFALSTDESHHLLKVMRGEVGDTVELVNGKGVLAQAQLTEIHKKEAFVTIESSQKMPHPSRSVILAWGMPHSSHLEWGIEKAVELGVSDIWLFPADKSVKKGLSLSQEERLRSLTVAAMKQSGRLFLPKVTLKHAIKDWKPLETIAYFGSLLSNSKPLSSYPIDKKDILIVIGPESGFSKSEEEKLMQIGAKPTLFNPHILRTETAVLAALSIILQNDPS